MSTGRINTWTTRTGEILDIAWMDSVHLQHAINMVARNSSFNPYLERELISRTRSPRDLTRETPEQMIWVRAFIDSGRSALLTLFYEDMPGYITHTLARRDSVGVGIIALAMKYRLTR